MIKKSIIDLIANKTKIKDRNLIEKDLILHRLLLELGLNSYFFNNYAFKGGTCLTKCYFDYYRFSEDLDFTYIHQEEFNKKNGKQIRKIISDKINKIMDILTEITHNVELDFKNSKNNKKYVEFGGSNQQTTFKLWYIPDNSSQETFIKIQINFLEIIEYKIIEKYADNLIFGKYQDFGPAFFLPEKSEWIFRVPKLRCYDIKEILIEKIRAILTRKGPKVRDYIDVYIIEKRNKLNIKNFKKEIIKKIKPMLKFEKYKKSFYERKASDFTINKNEEERIMLIPVPEDFDTFFNKIKQFLEEIIKELKTRQNPKRLLN